MEEVLNDLSAVNGIGGGILVSKEGLVISHFWKNEEELDLLAASLTDLVNLSSSFIEERVAGGPFQLVDIEGENLRTFIGDVNENTFLVVLADKDFPLGALRMEVKSACQKLRLVL